MTSQVMQGGPQVEPQQKEEEREKMSEALVKQLKVLFAKLVQTKKKYQDPSQVLASLVDEFGNKVEVGDQKDIGEFQLNFLERIEEGLHEKPPDAFVKHSTIEMPRETDES